MEVLLIGAAVIAVIGWWIWKEGKHEEAGHPLEGATKSAEIPPAPILTQVTVAPEPVEEVKEKPAKKKAAPKKEAAPKKTAAKKPAAPKKTKKSA